MCRARWTLNHSSGLNRTDSTRTYIFLAVPGIEPHWLPLTQFLSPNSRLEQQIDGDRPHGRY